MQCSVPKIANFPKCKNTREAASILDALLTSLHLGRRYLGTGCNGVASFLFYGMKKFLFVSILLYSVSLYSQPRPNFLTDDFLNKKIAKSLNIKSVTQYKHNYIFGKLDSISIRLIRHTYDKNGNLISIGYKDFGGGSINKYDTTNHLIEQRIYDKNRNLQSILEYKYDNEGKLIEGIIYNKNGKYDDKYIYLYNDKNELVSEKILNDENFYCEYKYDDYGRLISLHRGHKFTDRTYEIEFEYDINSNILKSVEFIEDYLIIKENTYNNPDKLFQTIETIKHSEDSIDEQYRYIFNYDKNVLMSKVKYDMKTSEPIEQISYQYEYY